MEKHEKSQSAPVPDRTAALNGFTEALNEGTGLPGVWRVRVSPKQQRVPQAAETNTKEV